MAIMAMCEHIYLLQGRRGFSLVPEWLFLGIYFCVTNLALGSSWVCTRAWARLLYDVRGFQIDVFIHLFVRRATCMYDVLTRVISLNLVWNCFRGLLGLLCCEETLEDNVSELAIHEWIVNVDEDAARFGLNDAYIMHATWANSDYFPVH